jgi:hypothetical protein
MIMPGADIREQAIKHSMTAFQEWRETTGWKRREVLGNVSLSASFANVIHSGVSTDDRCLICLKRDFLR